MTKRRPRRKDSGFAMLLIFLMAAVIAITLYMEIPRVAFESQRQKEQLLVERGEEYKRAIQLFQRANGNRWPARIEELESYNNRRFLRKRFKDPITGKDEWRVIHVSNGVLTDSHNNKQKKDGKGGGASTAGQYVGEQVGLVAAAPNANGAGNALAVATRKRDSDNRIPMMDGSGNPNVNAGFPVLDPQTGQPYLPGQGPQGGQQPQPVNPGGFPGAQPGGMQPGGMQPGGMQPGGMQPGGMQPVGMQPVGMQPGMPPVGMQPGQMPGGMVQSPGSIIAGRLGGQQGQQGTTGSTQSSGGSYVGSSGPYVGGGTYIGSQPSNPSGPSAVSGQGQFPGNPVNSQAGGVSPAYGTNPGASGMAPGNFQQPGMQTGQNSVGLAAIQQLLTQPRPGGMPNANPGMAAAMGGGIAGFASTADSESIMIYNDQTNYGDWEFIFDPSKVKPLFNPNNGAIGQSAASMGSMPGGLPGTPVQQMAPGGLQPGGMQPGGMQPGGMTPAGMNGGFGAGQPMGSFPQQPPIRQ